MSSLTLLEKLFQQGRLSRREFISRTAALGAVSALPQGRSEMVFLRENLVVEDGKYTGQLGQGNFLKAEPYGAAYDSLRQNRSNLFKGVTNDKTKKHF